jgi:hypothetical protein
VLSTNSLFALAAIEGMSDLDLEWLRVFRGFSSSREEVSILIDDMGSAGLKTTPWLTCICFLW